MWLVITFVRRDGAAAQYILRNAKDHVNLLPQLAEVNFRRHVERHIIRSSEDRAFCLWRSEKGDGREKTSSIPMWTTSSREERPSYVKKKNSLLETSDSSSRRTK